MGSCLSKSGKKGKGEDEDKTPYAPADKRTPSPGERPQEVPLQRSTVQGVESKGRPSDAGPLNTAPHSGKTHVSILTIISLSNVTKT